jgi:hypothetical protein
MRISTKTVGQGCLAGGGASDFAIGDHAQRRRNALTHLHNHPGLIGDILE